MDALELDYPHLGRFGRSAHEFAVYLAANRGGLINHGERFRAGERISSAMAESTVNAVVSERLSERQQMQTSVWPPLQTAVYRDFVEL